ncbi:PP2C family protein-serine/threonine phosphatase [Streptomyces geranii]|uniref:PP2C family protein-serine/threonine phosphatase n=1 Tax=Streptomyces geranii TaxID=2058923 RepID=UPI000D024099|nr:response regulator [Streptomyces geranii]
MPVPVPRQRAIPAVENGQGPTPAMPGGTPSTGTPGPAGLNDSGGPGGPGSSDSSSGAAGSAGTAGAVGLGGPSGETAPRKDRRETAAPPTGANPAKPVVSGTGNIAGTHLTLLLIQDDPGGSPVVPELLDAAGKPIRIRTARNLTEAERLLTDDVHCILLDLALPAPPTPLSPNSDDGNDDELAVLKHVLRLAPRHAVLALTASGDAERGTEAVRVGAQDYLFRDELDGRLLSRAIRYAVERKRSDRAERRLTESRLRAQENARLERGLLPTPLLDGSSLRFAARYRPGRSRALLGGDFYDTVRTPDGTVHAMIGDVCGHGPDEAALGVELRIAWRALTLAGLCGDALLGTLQQVLEHERENDEIFATLCTVDISPDGRSAGLCLAGHPAPLLVRPGPTSASGDSSGVASAVAELLPYDNNGPALGLLPGARWPRTQVRLGAEWTLMLYTDGLIEGHVGEGRERLGQDGMVAMIRRQLAQGLRGEKLLRAAVSEVRRLNGGELTDDLAVLLLDRLA